MKKTKKENPTKMQEIQHDDLKNLQHKDVPASVGLVLAVRDELKALLTAYDHRFEAIEQNQRSHDHRFAAIEAKQESHDHRFTAHDRRFDAIDAKFEQMREEMHAQFGNIRILFEQQRSENRIVLDGLKNISEKQDRESKRIDGLENILRDLRKPTPSL